MIARIPPTGVADAYSVHAKTSDINGIYTVAEFNRKDNTLYARSTLKDYNAATSVYNKLQLDYFNDAGTVLLHSEIWLLTWDVNGLITDKVVT